MTEGEEKRTSPAKGAEIDIVSAELDELLALMQTPEAEGAMLATFRASPEELGRLALEAARRAAPE
jgi:hypothetical protein